MRRHRARRTGNGPTSVVVIDAAGQVLDPCPPARARQLVRRGRAWFLTTEPPLIQLIHHVPRETRKHP
jgi:hypothetical protein